MANLTTQFVKSPDLTKVLQPEHAGQWVAFSHDYNKVLASGNTVENLLKKLSQEEKNSELIFYKVPVKDSYYIPSIQ